MYAEIGQKSNTMIFADRPADVNALLAQASTVVKAVAPAAAAALAATHGASSVEVQK